MAGAGELHETPLDLIRRGYERMAGQPDEAFGPIATELQGFRDRSEANSAEALRRFEKSGAWVADGSLSMVAWLRTHGKLSGGAAMERITIARQLDKLPETEKAFQRGDLGYEHVAIMSRTAQHVGVAAVQQAESVLLEAARGKDPGQFSEVTKEFEHRSDGDAALRETNKAGSCVRPASPDAARRGLDAGTIRRPLADQATAAAGPGTRPIGLTRNPNSHP
jgi:hypothetical protein